MILEEKLFGAFTQFNFRPDTLFKKIQIKWNFMYCRLLSAGLEPIISQTEISCTV